MAHHNNRVHSFGRLNQTEGDRGADVTLGVDVQIPEAFIGQSRANRAHYIGPFNGDLAPDACLYLVEDKSLLGGG